MFAALVCTLLLAQGGPLFYWGDRAPTVEMPRSRAAGEPAIETVHAAREGADLLLKISYDRPLSEALQLSDGTPVSGRLRALLYLDCDAERKSGLEGREDDARVGAERLIEVGVMALGADEEEHLPARALVMVGISELLPRGERKITWQADEDTEPKVIALRGHSIELRLPSGLCLCGPRARLIVAQGGELGSGLFDATLEARKDEGERRE